MTGIGFNADVKDTVASADVNSVEELEQFINREVRQYGEFESELILELKDIKHMEYNLKQLGIQMKAVEALAKQYNDLNEKLYFEMHKREGIDIKKCEEFMNMLNRIRSELGPMNNRIVGEAEKLFVNETHKIYNKSESERKFMESIDVQARKMVSKIILIDNQAKGIEEKYRQMVDHLNKLKQGQPSMNAKNDVGFHP